MKYIPSVLLNSKVFWGNWDRDNIMEAVCSGLINKPDICFRDNTLVKKDKKSSNLMWIIIAVCLIISVAIFVYCRYQIKKNIATNLDSSNFGHKISTVVTTYLALKDTKSQI